MELADKDILRFNTKVAVRGKDECWEWLGGKDRNGYGKLWVSGKMRLAHRLSFQLQSGRAATNAVLHSCDNPGCVNPHHLRDGTQAENVADRQTRNRHARGELIGLSKLTDSEVTTIRQMNEETFLSQAAIGRLFGIGRSQANKIILRRTWRHV